MFSLWKLSTLAGWLIVVTATKASLRERMKYGRSTEMITSLEWLENHPALLGIDLGDTYM